MSKWQSKKLGDFIKVKHGYAFKGKNITDEETDAILVTPGNFKIGGGFKSSKFKYFNSDYPEDYVLSEGDIVVTMTDLSKESDTLGYSAKIPAIEGKVLLHNQRIGLVEFKDNNVSKYYLYWLMRTAEYQWYCVSSASGTSIMHTSPSRIEDYDFKLPPLSEQHAIASVLSSLDNKIDLLHRQNQTLEQMAETLFRQWFVEEADEEWEERTLDDCVELIIDHRGKTPKKLGYDWSESGIAAISAKNVKNGRLVRPETYKFVDEELYARWMKDELQRGDILMTSEAPLGELYFLNSDEKFVLSQRLYGIRANDLTSPYFLYEYLKSSEGQNEISGRASGTTVFGIRQSELRKVAVPIPDKKLIEEFDNVVGPLYSKIDLNQKQIQNLTALRDTLLPKLMSGEIRLNYD